MKCTLWLLLLLFGTSEAGAQEHPNMFDIKTAERFANLALACVHKEYPNHISHTLNSDADAAPPRKLTPAFYGCYDWHSSVPRALAPGSPGQDFPGRPVCSGGSRSTCGRVSRQKILRRRLHISGEQGRVSFERPYGLAWLFNWSRNLREWDDPQAKEMAANLHPLEEVVLERLKNWLPKLSNPVRIGEHDQTAFALGLMLDYAHGNGDQKFAELVVSKARQFYLSDKNCPLAYEPSGEDFLSPCLGEADLMRRVLPSREFAALAPNIYAPNFRVGQRVNGCSPLCRLIPAIRSWRTWMGSISAEHGC